MVKSTGELSSWIGLGCPTTWKELLKQGYESERGYDFEGWEIYDRNGHHIDNLYFDANVPFGRPWPKDFMRIRNDVPIVRAMVTWHAKNGSVLNHTNEFMKSLSA